MADTAGTRAQSLPRTHTRHPHAHAHVHTSLWRLHGSCASQLNTVASAAKRRSSAAAAKRYELFLGSQARLYTHAPRSTQIHSSYEDGSEMVEEFDVNTDELMVSRARTHKNTRTHTSQTSTTISLVNSSNKKQQQPCRHDHHRHRKCARNGRQVRKFREKGTLGGLMDWVRARPGRVCACVCLSVCVCGCVCACV